MRALVVAGAVVLTLLLGLPLVPAAAALDVLPPESSLGHDEARILVRAHGPLVVRTEPPVLVGANGSNEELSATPRTLHAEGTWRGLEGVIELRLQRPDPRVAVDVFLHDEGSAGAWIEWPAASLGLAGAGREVPAPGVGALLAGVLAAGALARLAACRQSHLS